MYKYKYNDQLFEKWSDLRKLFPQVSFPTEDLLTPEILSKYNIIKIETLEDVKLAKIEELKNERDRRENEDLEVIIDNKSCIFDFFDKARERINNAIIALEVSGGSLIWTLADDNSIEVTADILKNVIATAAVRSNTLHIKYRTLRDLVNSKTTIEEVKEINWDYIINE